MAETTLIFGGKNKKSIVFKTNQSDTNQPPGSYWSNQPAIATIENITQTYTYKLLSGLGWIFVGIWLLDIKIIKFAPGFIAYGMFYLFQAANTEF